MGAELGAMALISLVSAGTQIAAQQSIASKQEKNLKEAEAKNQEQQNAILSEEEKTKKAQLSVAKGNEQRAASAARMQSLAAKARGRESTILTDVADPYQQDNKDGQKTLLGA